MTTFASKYVRVEPDLSNGSSLKGLMLARYCDLVCLLGEPDVCDMYKVSGEWVLQDDEGNIVTLYDWKSTNLYDPDYPSVAEFRDSMEFQEFHVGGHNLMAARAFVQALNRELQLRNQKPLI